MKKKIAGALLAGYVAASALTTSYEGRVIRVIDSDTQEIAIAVWPGLLQTISVRNLGIDTPEKFRPDPACAKAERALALEATALVEKLIPPGSTVRVTNVGPDKYFGRATAIVWYCPGEKCAGDAWQSLSLTLVQSGHAYAYDGGTKRSWCEILDQPRPTRPGKSGAANDR